MSWMDDPLHDERDEQRSARRGELPPEDDRPTLAEAQADEQADDYWTRLWKEQRHG